MKRKKHWFRKKNRRFKMLFSMVPSGFKGHPKIWRISKH